MPHGDHWRPVGAIYRCTLMNSSHSSPKATIAITTQLGLSVPIIQAPMAGSQASPQAIALAAAGAMGSLPGASLAPQALRDEVRAVRAARRAQRQCQFLQPCDSAGGFGTRAGLARGAAAVQRGVRVDPANIPTGPGRLPFDDALWRSRQTVTTSKSTVTMSHT